MSREDPQMKVRMSEDLRDRIATAAKAAGRSMNAEIVVRLEESFDPTQIERFRGIADEISAKLMDEVTQMMDKRLLEIEKGMTAD